MTMSPRSRRFALTAHVTCSVGWLGAVAVVLALAVAGVASRDLQLVRAVYLAMELIGWTVLVPLSLASLVTGLVQSVGTSWGLFRHYWVLAKLLINVVASIILLLYMQSLGYLASVAAEAAPSTAGLGELRSPAAVIHSAAALVLLLLAAALSVYKPRGVTPYGLRRERERRLVEPS